MRRLPETGHPAGLLRRLGAMVYDLLLVLAVMMVVTALFLPATGGEAITPVQSGVLEYLYRVTLLAIVVGFFGVFWTRRGQTLGMAAWRLKVEREDGRLLTWKDSLKRLGAACLSWLPAGAGFLWIVIDREHLAWHDRLSHTRIIVEPKKPK
jgi:uncharacterized RDD family membrane protein YckC